jgi:predicted PurR-regulated permease PerM
MAEEHSPTPPQGAPEASRPTARERRPRLGILLGFLGAFLLLLFLFRDVLFPFLMAMFIAYLIEPLVAAFTRSPIFGVRWTRGPTIVLMYVLLLGGIVLASSCAVAQVTKTVKEVSSDVTSALGETAERARFRLVGDEMSADGAPLAQPLEQDVLLPAGTRVVMRPHAPGPRPGTGGVPEAADEPPAPEREVPPAEPTPPKVYETLYDVAIPAGSTEGTVLLEETKEPPPRGTYTHPRLLDPSTLRYADGSAVPADAARMLVQSAELAVGLEVWVERNLVTPIVGNLEKAGFSVQPTELRALLSAQTRALGENLPQKVTAWGRNAIGRLALGVYEFILILMLTAFIVLDRKVISSFFLSLPPPRHRDAYATLVRYVDRGLAGVIRGQLVICGVNGVLTYVGLLIFQVKGAFVLSLLAGIFSLIPIFGTILSSIPIVLVATTEGIDKGLFALGWIALIHLLEANLLNPLIMGSHARMHPVVIIFALLAGEHTFGVWGALLAVPTMSIIQSCFQFYRYEIEGIEPAPVRAHGEGFRRVLKRIFGRKAEPSAPPGASA